MTSPQRICRRLAALGSSALVLSTGVQAAVMPPAQPPARSLQAATPAQTPPVEIELTADRQGFDKPLGRFVAAGNVQALISGGRLLADRLEYEPNTRTIYVSGSIRFQRGQQYLQASRLRYSLIEDRGELEDVYGVIDFDTADVDADIAKPPAAGLLPLRYWSAANPLFQGKLAWSSRQQALIQGPPARTVVVAPLQGLEQQPLSPTGSGTQALGQPLFPYSVWRGAVNGMPALLPPRAWRMPPIALSPAAQTMACPPPLPPIPDWHPYPWATTLWGGQMIDANFGDTFIFKGQLRPEYLGGLGLNRRLVDAGPLALEFDANALLHRAYPQAGGEFNQAVPYANTPAQTFGEFTGGFGVRAWVQPWLSFGFVEGVSLYTSVSNYEKTFRENYTTFLNYLGFEVEALMAPEWSLVGRIHHRSGAYGTYSGVSEGSNAYLLGLRYRSGQSPPQRPSVAMGPPSGCPGAGAQQTRKVAPLGEQLNAVAMGQKPAATGTPAVPPAAAKPEQLPPGQQERLRREAIAASVDQRVSDLSFQRSLTAERRAGFQRDEVAPDEVNAYGEARPPQIQRINTAGNQELVKGTVNRWRFQAATLRITARGWEGDHVAFSNDPYTPAQSWVDAEGVVAVQLPNGDIQIRSKRSRAILEDRLPIPMRRNLLLAKDKDVDNPWVLSVDGNDRDGFYIGRNLTPVKIGQQGRLELQPQFMVQRALNGTTDSYVLPGSSAGSAAQSQPVQIGDLFGLLAKLKGKVLGFESDTVANISTLDPNNFANGTRSWGDLTRPVRLPWLGSSTARLFGAYRYRIWNGSLGEQDVYSALGASLEQKKDLPKWGLLSNNYFWRLGFGNFQGNEFQTSNLGDFWRASAFGSLNSSYPLWTGRALDSRDEATTRYSATPVVPGLTLNTNTSFSLAYYGDGTNQNTLSLTGGPTLTLGHLTKRFFDYTQFTITGGGTLRQGESPFSFDRAVDLGTLGLGLTQQLVGPLMFSGGVGLNVDPNSEFYGDVTGASVELRWQRRSYEFAIFYSPYEQLGGIRLRLNDFNFNGTGVPFVPYHPSNAYLGRRSLF